MSKLHWTDWYLNRAFCCLLWGAGRLSSPRGRFKRDERYYAEAARKRLREWRNFVREQHVPSPAQRGLAPLNDDEGHVALWDAQNCQGMEQLNATIVKLEPYLALKFPTFDAIPHCTELKASS